MAGVCWLGQEYHVILPEVLLKWRKKLWKKWGDGRWRLLSSNAWWAVKWKRIWIPSLQLWGLEQKLKVMVHRPNLSVDMLFGSQNVGPQCFKGFETVANLKVRRCHIKIPYSIFFEKNQNIWLTFLQRNNKWELESGMLFNLPQSLPLPVVFAILRPHTR